MHDPLERLKDESERFSVPDQDLDEVMARGRRARRTRRVGIAAATAVVLSLGAVAVASLPDLTRDTEPIFKPPPVVEPHTKARVARFTYMALKTTVGGAIFDYKDVEATDSGWRAIYVSDPRMTNRLERIQQIQKELSRLRQALRRAQRETDGRARPDGNEGSVGRAQRQTRAHEEIRRELRELREKLSEQLLRRGFRSAPVGSESLTSVLVESIEGRLAVTGVGGPLPADARDELLGFSSGLASADPEPGFLLADVQLSRGKKDEVGFTIRAFYLGEIPAATKTKCRISLMLDEGNRVVEVEHMYAPTTEDDRDELLLSGTFEDVPGRGTDFPLNSSCRIL